MTPDRDLLIKIFESLAEQKAMLKTALERQDKTDERVDGLEGRVQALELDQARQKGRAGVVGTISGTAAGFGTGMLVPYMRAKLGF